MELFLEFFILSKCLVIALSVILFITLNWILNHQNDNSNYLIYTGLLAIATLIGTFIQFAVQCWEIHKIGLFRFKSAWLSYKYDSQ